MPDLWCKPCDQAHRFTEGETERLVYALATEVEHVAALEPASRDDEDELCLESVLTASLAGHRDAVEEAVDARRDFVRQYGGSRG